MGCVFDVVDFGAVSDGGTVNTSAIQGAIDACAEAGGGRVVFGAGVWVTGALELKSHVELHLAAGCRIVGSRRLEDYSALVADGFKTELSAEKSAHGLIWAVGAEDIAITGAGVIDGSGLAFYDTVGAGGKYEKPATPRPRIGMFYRCRNVRITDATFVDSACWTLWLMRCEGVTISRIAIRGDRRMRNIDGIDVDSCRNVTVSDCRIDTEDDCVVLRAMQRLYDEPVVCENVTVTNCVLKSGCQGVRVGCPGDGVVRNCILSNLVIDSEINGIVFDNPKRYLAAGTSGNADVSGLMFSNVVINCKRLPIKVQVEDGIALKRLSDLSFSNFTIRSGGPCLVEGSKETIIRNVRFSNVRIATTGDDAIVCRHCEGVRMNGVELSNRQDVK